MGSSSTSLFEQLHRTLPQTQCRRCGYDDCAAYAQAIATQQAPINRCPPGGAEGVARLARLTGQPVLPLDDECGQEGPRTVAWIDENWCIGCTLCMQVCPTDAIVGANKAMHTVIEAECTGCELCIPACPVDCIHLDNVSGDQTGWQAWSPAQADHALARYQQHQARLAQRQAGPREARTSRPGEAPNTTQPIPASDADKRKALIAAALAKARAQRQG